MPTALLGRRRVATGVGQGRHLQLDRGRGRSMQVPRFSCFFRINYSSFFAVFAVAMRALFFPLEMGKCENVFDTVYPLGSGV